MILHSFRVKTGLFSGKTYSADDFYFVAHSDGDLAVKDNDERVVAVYQRGRWISAEYRYSRSK